MTVGRFQIMSLLQAARARVLGLPLESAYSWGLNRAIFIAAAKRGFKGRSREGSPGAAQGETGRKTYFLGDDMAFKTTRNGVVLFTIGGRVQTREEIDKRVRSRFGEHFPAAWKAALAYVKGFDRDVLLSREDFFGMVYRPVRDSLSEKWSEAAE